MVKKIYGKRRRVRRDEERMRKTRNQGEIAKLNEVDDARRGMKGGGGGGGVRYNKVLSRGSSRLSVLQVCGGEELRVMVLVEY